MHWKLLFTGAIFCFFLAPLYTQSYFPVKVNKKWGLIDKGGELVLEPVYNAIGEFNEFGFAVMQRNGLVGLLGEAGREILPARYDDIKVLDRSLVAVMDLGEWMVINLEGKIILRKGYDKVEVWDGGYLAFSEDDKWGVVTYSGKSIIPARYDEIYQEGEDYFITRKGDQLGVVAARGEVVLDNEASEIRIFNDSLLFFRMGQHWGAVNRRGQEVIPARYEGFRKLSDLFITLEAANNVYLFSIPCGQLISEGEYDEFYSFSRRYVLAKKNRQLGLLDFCGRPVLEPEYSEIQAYQREMFRVNVKGKWGVVNVGNEVIIPIGYDYIAPLKGAVCLVKKDSKFGVVNARGEEVIPPQYARIELSRHQAKAYPVGDDSPGESQLTVFSFDKEGNLIDGSNFNNHVTVRIGGKQPEPEKAEALYQLDNFEWFYSPNEDRWGLRKLSDGGVQIEPIFHYIEVDRQLGFTLVGIKKDNKYEFERTTFRFDMIFGLVNNEVGLPITEVDFVDLKLEDLRQGYPLARCVFSDGKYGLIDRIGRIVRKEMAFVGPFENGLARVSFQGRISGSLKNDHSLGKLQAYLADMLSPNAMVDYTQYDRHFRKNAYLICESCEWGFMDTTGQVVIKPQYTFVQNMSKEVGMVKKGNKWGMVSRRGDLLIPCQYDGVEFLENTDEKIIKVYKQEPKYGLIDTLGQLAVGAVYDEIGSFSEGRLAVSQNNLWGFVDAEGKEVVPCRYKEVKNFSEGLAAVRQDNKWGFINKQGEVEIGFRYRRAGNFKEGVAWVSTERGYGYIDIAERFVIEPGFSRAYDFFQGRARVEVGGAFGLIDLSGKYVVRPRFSHIEPFNQYGIAIVRYGRDRIRYEIMDLNGNLITKKSYESIEQFSEGLAAVRDKNGYGFINTQGVLVIEDQYSRVSRFSEGRAAVYKNGNCGYINKVGQTTIDFEYSRCQDFEDGRAVINKGIRNTGLIDLAGEVLVEPKLNRLLDFNEGRGLVRDEKYRFYYITEQEDLYRGYFQKASSFKHGVAVVQIDGKWGIINQKGMSVIPPKYDKIEGFIDGYAKVRVEGFNGLSNLKGELIAEPDYEFISYAGQGLFRVEKGDKIGYFDAAGKWVWNLNN